MLRKNNHFLTQRPRLKSRPGPWKQTNNEYPTGGGWEKEILWTWVDRNLITTKQTFRFISRLWTKTHLTKKRSQRMTRLILHATVRSMDTIQLVSAPRTKIKIQNFSIKKFINFFGKSENPLNAPETAKFTSFSTDRNYYFLSKSRQTIIPKHSLSTERSRVTSCLRRNEENISTRWHERRHFY